MTLLITLFAAILCTVLWYRKAPQDEMKISVLCFLYWGAAIMWFVDAIYEYADLGAAFFAPAPADMLNDLFLGLSVVALGLIVWLVVLLIKDPRGVIKGMFQKK
ncbi:MAG TPA: hypothetical protein PKA81_10570 [Clostridia bacterium]|nr:hypothetical protein [Clostridia bacterium]